MARNAIHFGTSGWRGIIADDFTFEGVRRASAAVAAHMLSLDSRPRVLVGYDTRFFSREFALAAAETLRAHGCEVSLCGEPAPTPAIACEVVRARLDGAVNITASHNPAEYNGLKFSGPNGGPALPEVTKDIEHRAGQFAEDEFGAPLASSGRQFSATDIRDQYFARLAELVRFDKLAACRGVFVCDALHGCGAGWLDRVLTNHGVECVSLRTDRDVLYDGDGPDPSEEKLEPTRIAVREHHALAGLATDGDADRFGIIDRDGSFISPNHILALLFDYLIESRGWKLGATRSVATTHFVDAVATKHGVPLYETPVGFKYVGEFLAEDLIVIGGEESAGLTIRGHVPEKDGILACLLVAEMIAARGQSLAEQRATLFERVGRPYWPIRINIHLDPEIQAGLGQKLKREPRDFGGRTVKTIDRKDGLKLILEDGDWVLMRPSGTEPLVRIYSESTSEKSAHALAEEARKWIHQ